MSQLVKSDCPKCGRPLQRFNGRIGYCSLHKWVSPSMLGFDAEAAEQNRLEDVQKEKTRLEAEKLRAEENAKKQQERHQSAVRKAIFILVALLAIAALVTVFILRPRLIYKTADKYFNAGEYEFAQNKFAALGGYKDSALRASLCEALNDLRSGRVEEGAEKLETLVRDAKDSSARQLVDVLAPIFNNWKENGLTPQMLLRLLDQTRDINSRRKWDAQNLSVEGHTALLDRPVRNACARDINRDGQLELIVLNEDRTISIYRMTVDGNAAIKADDSETAACAMVFGMGCEENAPLDAVACYALAYRLTSDKESLSRLTKALRNVVSNWEKLGLDPAEIPPLIYLAESQGIELSGLKTEAIFEKAALATAGNTVQSSFVDWDRDGWRELLALDSNGRLSLFGGREAWHAVAYIDTELPGCSYAITDEAAPLILVTSAGEDVLIALTGGADQLNVLFRENGITRYSRKGTEVSFAQRLEGSIERSSESYFEAIGIDNRPVRTAIDWQQNHYPQPTNARETVQRFFEAFTYGITDEAALLVASPLKQDIFSLEGLLTLLAPDSVSSLAIAPYQTESDRVLYEVHYQASGRAVCTWVSVEYVDGWKITGAADTYGAGLDPTNMDASVPLLSLNEEAVSVIPEKGGRTTYRMLIPTSGRLGLRWQSGTKEAARSSYSITMLRGSLTGESVFTYDLKPSPSRQQSKDMFVSAGVYYVTVEAKSADTEEYHLRISLNEEESVELENNDTSASATLIKLDTPYSGSLSGPDDIDFFMFALSENCGVNVTMDTAGTGGKSAFYAYAVYSAADGARLASVSVPGNARLSETGNLYLAPGSYYVQVAKGSSYTNDEYTLTVNTHQNDTAESESNDTRETATAVPVNTEIHGSFSREGDVDYYAFTLDSSAVIQPRFTFTPTEGSSKTYVLTVLDAAGHELLKVNIGAKESTKNIAPLALPVGTYMLKLENPRFVRQDYMLYLACAAVAATELEPNDTAGLATELTIGRPIIGVTSSDTDSDYYRLRLDQDATVTLRFSFAQSTAVNTAFVLSIEQNGKTQWTANIRGDSGGLEQQLYFPAGEYYLRVKPSSWLSAVYTIELI